MEKPNILFIMSDQHSIRGVGCYGDTGVRTPHIDALARTGVRFSNVVCPSPICVAARAALFAGKHPHRIGAWGNAGALDCDEITFMHHLLAAGYSTTAAGKCHFIGPDQEHGFQERLTPDIYPAEPVWIDDWDQPLTRDGGNNRDRVAEAGVIHWNASRDYDEEAAHRARERLRQIAAGDFPQPFFLYVSFTHPHDPYQTTQEYWDRYEGVDLRLSPHWNQDARTLSTMNQWVQRHHDLLDPVDPGDALRARRAYFGNCSYVDDKVGELVAELERQGLRENTAVLFASDHGEMLGEHGMWSKRTFYEGSAHVPLILNIPEFEPKSRVLDPVVSLLDLYPTLLDLAGAPPAEGLDGQSLLPLARGETRGRNEAYCEYTGDGVLAPCRMILRGSRKLCYTYGQNGELFDRQADPQEMTNVWDAAEYAWARDELLARLQGGWNATEIDRRVREAQKRLRFLASVRLRHLPQWGYRTAGRAPHSLPRDLPIGCGVPRAQSAKV
ncbi:MAG: Choline-sulfatase [candidate division BRC1 bacterium ADurb.BinA364]|nr:MAG: Choline-sulfatase [candidate division BRC1 bacterium ADurb.BinA364]